MSKYSYCLIVIFAISANLSFAADESIEKSTFQNYFANMRQCLSSDKVETCLPPKLGIIVVKPGPNYTREQFVNLVLNDQDFRNDVSSCFAVSAQIIMDFGYTKLFRSEKYACQAININGVWQLTQFYNYFSNE